MSSYTGKSMSDGEIHDYNTKLSKFENIPLDKDDLNLFITTQTIQLNLFLVVLKNSIELMNDDIVSLKKEIDTDRLITFVLVGWEKREDGYVWILSNNFNNNWSDQGFTSVPFDDKNIVEIY